MAAKKETAEQKLLKLIENSKGQKDAPPAAQSSAPSDSVTPVAPPVASEQVAMKVAQSVRSPALPGIALPVFLQNLGGVFKKGGAPGAMVGLGLRQVNSLLTLTTVAVMFFFTGKLFLGWSQMNQQISFLLDGKVTRTGEREQLIPLTKDVAYYLDLVQTRNIFKPYEKKQGKETKFTGDNRVVASKTEHLKLRGISWLDSAETASAIIEDADSGMTYFLKQGDQVKDVTVKTIYADQVIMSYEGEEIAIKL